MNKILKKTLRTALLAALSLAVILPVAGGELPEYIRNAPGLDDYPGADGLFLRRSTTITIDADGKITRNEESAIRMFGPRILRTGLLDPSIDWNDARSDLTIDTARSYLTDGTVVDALENSLVPNTAGQLQWAAAYSHLRQITVAQVGVEYGGTTVLAYTIADRAPESAPLWGVIEMGSFLPVIDARAVFVLPEGHPFHYAGISCDLEPEIVRADGVARYSFTGKNLAAVHTSEPGHGMEGACRLLYSTAENWHEARTILQGEIDGAVLAEPELSAKAEEIAGDGFQQDEKVARIHDFVIDGVRTIRWPLVKFEYSTRPATEVLLSSVGHPLEKAALLAAMLQSIGIEACVALAAGEPGEWPDVPSPVPFDRAWVRVGSGPHHTWLDPTTSSARANRTDLEGHSILLLDGTEDTSPAVMETAREVHRSALFADIRLKADGDTLVVSGTADVDLSGRYNRLPVFDRSSNRLAPLASATAGSFGNCSTTSVWPGRLNRFETSFRTEFNKGSLEVTGSGLVVVELPLVRGALRGEDLEAHRMERTLPLELPGPALEQSSITLHLPDGYELEYVPAETRINNAAGSFRRTVEQDGREMTVVTVFDLKTTTVSPADYPALRTLLAAREGDTNEKVLLRRTD